MKKVKKVLLLEDDKSFAETLKKTLEDKGWSVKITDSTRQAEQFVTFERYNLIIIDVVLRTKVNGIDFLKNIISKGLLSSSCKVWIVSGVLSKNIIPKELRDHVDSFLKKPFSTKLIEEKLSNLNLSVSNISRNIDFFYLETSKEKNLLKNMEFVIKGHELMFIVFYLNQIDFNGELKISTFGADYKTEILFKEGNLISFKDIDTHHKIGEFLIKNNVISADVLQKLLKEDSNLPLGERLVQGCYISPHQLNEVLKHQLAVRLFAVMDFSTIKITCNDFMLSDNFEQFLGLEIRDLYALVYNWIHSKVNVIWIKEFFNKYNNMEVKNLGSFSTANKTDHYPSLEQLFTTNLRERREDLKIRNILKNSQKKEIEILHELYVRILVKENYLDFTENLTSFDERNFSFLNEKYTAFLESSKTKNYFELLNLPLNATSKEIEEVYKNMVRLFHSDRRDIGTPQDLIAVYDKCFMLVKKIHQTLNDPLKKKAYLQTLEVKERQKDLKIKEEYLNGKSEIFAGHYTIALNRLEPILEHTAAPNDIVLYYIWAFIKNKNLKITTKDKRWIEDLFKRVGIESKQSAIYSFVKGLFYKVQGNNKEAFNFFTTAILLDPKLKEARIEKYSLRKFSGKKSFFNNLFKKPA